MSRHLPLNLSLFMLCLLLAWGVIPVQAATIIVNSTADSGAGSLRTALTSAAAGDTITFTTSGTLQLLSNLPTLTQTDLTIEGNTVTILGGASVRSFTVTIGASVTINKLTMTGGNCNSVCPVGNSGGGIYNSGTLTLTNSTVSGNLASAGGGGIYNDGTLTLTNSTLSGNLASAGGGGILNYGTLTLSNSTLSDNSASAGIGGGIWNSGGTPTINNSTLSGNSAIFGGGGIYNSSGTMTLSNSTLSGNSASSGGGGGIGNEGTLTISNSTLSGNSASAFSGGIGNWGTVTLKNTLLDKGVSGVNCYGTFASNGAAYNLSDDGSCGANVTQVASLGLGALGANGGPTQTIPLLTGSPALDAALAADCPATDQRGETRPSGAGCDIGAFEYVVASSVASVVPTLIPAPALCSLTGFSSSPQVAISLPNGGGLNVCYSLISDPVQAGVTDRPFTLAAEVYTFDASGSVTTGVPVQVCLQGAGTLLFRNATGQPRTTVSLPSFSQGGFTCGLIPNAGTVILIPGAASPAAAIPPTALSACRVTTTNILNLRAAPDATSAILDHVPYQTTLSASARADEWLQVVFGSQQGWLSAAYLTLEGGCG